MECVALVPPASGIPASIDVRGVEGVPRGLGLLQPTMAQVKALARLEFEVGAPLMVEYNGLTTTPRHLFSAGHYLTGPRAAPAEIIARDFLQANRGLFRFTDEDLQGLRLRSRATLPDAGVTILVLQQRLGDIPVHQGEVLFTIAANGQIISVGNDNFPGLTVDNDWRISPEMAITAAAAGLGMPGLFPYPIGDAQVLRTYGDLPPEYATTPAFSGGRLFGGEIAVSRVVFPLGERARFAYEFILETPQIFGMMWQLVIDAGTGEILRRVSLTSFQQGGGVGVGRRASFRPDVQDMAEAMNPARTAQAQVFDTYPTMLSGRLGFGRSTRTGADPDFVYTQPVYAAESQTVQNSGRGFKYSQLNGRHESGVPFSNPATPETFPQSSLVAKLGAVNRGFPDATNPSKGSPFGWFYLPTDNGGAEIAAGNSNRAATRAFGYSMATEAKNRNAAANSPDGDGAQPYSATVTSLPGPIGLADGRSMASVIQSNYTEGNNALVADDRANDNESTHGIRGYSATRQFTAPYFDFINSYEYGGVNAASGVFPPSTNPDVFPATVSLFFLNNILHDYLYEIGFTESLWNFQQDNFGRGGAANDAVSAQAMDGSGINNANFGTPADGSRPRMQMFLWTEDGTRRADGNFDFDVVAHELYHGVSNRSAAKGSTGCMGLTAVGESGGQGEGLGDFLANSMADDDTTGEYVTGELDRGIRRIPYTNFRWSYEGINQRGLTRRDRVLPPDFPTAVGTGSVPFAVHATGEIWGATLWDVRELLIMSEPGGMFYDGSRRLGTGTSFYIGPRRVQSVDSLHPIDYRVSFRTTHDPVTGLDGTAPNITSAHFVRPGLVAAEIQSRGNRQGPLALAVARGGRKVDTLVLRGLQLGPCNPSFVESRNAMLLADREIYGGENRSMIWRAFASHGVGAMAASSGGSGGDQGSQSAPVVVEDFSVPAGVSQCEQNGPLPNPAFTLANTQPNTATVTINGGVPVVGASSYLISRASSAEGPFANIASIPATTTSFNDDDGGAGLPLNGTFYYKVRAARDADANCMSASDVRSVTITVGIVVPVSPTFSGLEQVGNPQVCDRLLLSWKSATSTSPSANIVYDIFRTPSVTPGDGTQEPTFVPATGNRIQEGVKGTSFADTALTLNQPYYYIVQARDVASGRIDANNVGNRQVRFNAATSTAFGDPVFALENFETPAANSRFTPALQNSATRNQGLAAWQRVPGLNLGGSEPTTAMYAPDFDPGSDGAQSDFSAVIGPLTLVPTAVLEFDGLINSEAAFDGGVVELALGGPNFNATPFPDNTSTFDLGNYMVAGGYNGKLDGTLAGPVFLSSLQARRAFTGVRGLTHTRIVLRDFAPGGSRNAAGAPVYIRFRMTSDAGSTNGPGSGWIVDNVVINTQLACPLNNPPFVSDLKNFDVDEGTHVTLVGSAEDPDDDALTYAWEQTGNSGDPAVTLEGSDSVIASFTAPMVNGSKTVTFRLTVTDPSENSAFDDVTVTIRDLDKTGGSDPYSNNRLGGGLPIGSLVILALAAWVRRRSH